MLQVVSFLSLVVLLCSSQPGLVLAQSTDKEAPEISNVEVSQVSESSVTVTWETDEFSDSTVNYGLQPDYGIVRIPIADRTQHSITLDNLEPGRVYYFRVVSADDNGNQGISADYRVQTSGTPQTGDGSGTGQSTAQGQGQGAMAGDGSSSQTQTETESTTNSQSQTQTTQEIVEQINQITDPQQLKEIVNETVKAIQGITEDLTIVGPPTVIPETTTAVVRWTTDREASSKVIFSPSQGFDGTNFAYAQESTQGNTTEHEVQLIGLSAFTDYSFKVISTDTYGITGESRTFTFQTKATMPEIRNLRVLKVEENAATLAWDTNVPTKALVEYQDQTTGEQQSVGRPTLSTTHQMRLSDLTLGTRYVAFVTAENSGGDRVRSQPVQFITVRDTAPPIITNVTNESTLFPGGESRIQTIVAWDTDESASCLMTYQEGVAGGSEAYTIEKEQISYNTKHVEVIVDFAPATVYQFYLTCTDAAANTIKSENFVLFTPIQEKNIIDLILENFQSTFGWVKNIGG
ncbi:MAG: hypothetical protein RL097_40 [Candidatus Parcubacteria bacterium]|jgi:hypothetical protein